MTATVLMCWIGSLLVACFVFYHLGYYNGYDEGVLQGELTWKPKPDVEVKEGDT